LTPVRDHRPWPEYAIEAALLGLFMVSACVVTVLLEHPASSARIALASALVRRALSGAAMGLTAVALIYSPWGQRSGAHFNPAVTIAFHRLGKIGTRDAVGYVVAQCAGGIAGVQLAHLLLGMAVAHPTVAFAATVPGPRGSTVAFLAEAAISFVQMSAVLLLANGRWRRVTGVVAGTLVAIWITFEAPLSGMSMNPARSLGSALGSGIWSDFWIYATAPLVGMIAAAEIHARVRGLHRVYCAKLVHDRSTLHCIFRCTYGALAGVTPGPARPSTMGAVTGTFS
jgi:aquaporin Z